MSEIPNGIYRDLSIADYVADPAISGSALSVLLREPEAYPDFLAQKQRPDQTQTKFQVFGSAAHCAILEGIEAFKAHYVAQPDKDDYPEALATIDDLKEWLRERKGKLTGTKSELSARAREIAALCNEPVILWSELEAQLVGGRETLSPNDYEAAIRLAKFVRSSPSCADLFDEGVPELSVFWTEDGERFKARFDWIGPAGVVELKTYSRPAHGSLRQHLAREIGQNDYHLQAAHAMRAFEVVRESGEFRDIASSFHWVFVRSGGPLNLTVLPLSFGSMLAMVAREQIRDALRNLQLYRETFPDGADWATDNGVVDLEDKDFPSWMWGATYV